MRRKRAAGGAGPAQRPPKRGRGGAAGEAIAVPGMAPGVRDFDQAMEGAGCGDSDDDLGVAGRLFELANSSAVRFSVGGQSVTVVQQPSVEGTGGVIWETSYALAIQLAPLLQQAPGALRVLEVGAGCGLCGIALARLGADVVVTEQESAMGNLGENVRRNAPAGSEAPYRCRPLRLAWGEERDIASARALGPFDWIVGTDVVFAKRLVAPLLDTLDALCHGGTTVWLCLQVRCAEAHAELLRQAPRRFSLEQSPLRGARLDFAAELDCMLLRLRPLRGAGGAEAGALVGTAQRAAAGAPRRAAGGAPRLREGQLTSRQRALLRQVRRRRRARARVSEKGPT
eukprot:TRINITY_DN36431_c0_g1_i1.p1 TRINITY_DN36431_c0_g1~~TRINITY_DN36431_c0_g1_i1.p1  ORF type:complete len:361 (+),score=111.17 TRINITY_DN36431_c0_g1_i1:60-1085(+)